MFAHMHVVMMDTGQHLALVAVALAISIALALPLGVLAARHPTISAPLLAALGVLYTIPSLAILALLVAYVGLGAGPALVTMVAYAQFVLVRNVAAALHGVPVAQSDAAMGLGMSDAQRLMRVELPSAFPVILGGVRIAAVALIAIASLAGYVNGGGLGTMIFDGLQRDYLEEILAGSIPIALLAIAVDTGFRLIERRASRWR